MKSCIMFSKTKTVFRERNTNLFGEYKVVSKNRQWRNRLRISSELFAITSCLAIIQNTFLRLKQQPEWKFLFSMTVLKEQAVNYRV